MRLLCLILMLTSLSCAPYMGLTSVDRIALYDFPKEHMMHSSFELLTGIGYVISVFDMERGIVQTEPAPSTHLRTRIFPGQYVVQLDLQFSEYNHLTRVIAHYNLKRVIGDRVEAGGLSPGYTKRLYDNLFNSLYHAVRS